MPEEIVTVVRIPISEIEGTVRSKHLLPKILTDAHLEEDMLVLCFSDETPPKEADKPVSKGSGRRRRARRRRNRMRTRGWHVMARITNSKGQKCSIYKPFVEALQDPKLTVEEQRRAVEKILRSNRNKPSEASINYFLENTLEFLGNKKNPNPPDNSDTSDSKPTGEL